MQSRMSAVLLSPANQTCADCPATHPEWVSFIYERSRRRPVGVLCCASCAQHHHFELGDKRCHIKYLNMTHEWDLSDIETLENTGNAFCNAIYEATLSSNDNGDVAFDKAYVDPCEDVECTRRAKFIKLKYKKRKFRKAESFDTATQRMHSQSPIRTCTRRATAPARDVAAMMEQVDETSLTRSQTADSLAPRPSLINSGSQQRIKVVHSPKRDMRNRRLSKISAASGMFTLTLPSEMSRTARPSFSHAA